MGFFCQLPDELLELCLELLDWKSLLRLGSTCRALFAFSSNDDLWKFLFSENPSVTFSWQGAWKSSFLDLRERSASINCRGLFSDLLYRPFQCSQVDLTQFSVKIPRQNAIPRISDLSPGEFSEKWSESPFILTGPVKEWPCFKTWTLENLLNRYGDVVFRAESVDWSLAQYVSYMMNTSDESPLYLFDRDFVAKMGLSPGHDRDSYWIPECFGEDLFALLGEDRPDSRWLIIGPERSGSTFHKDPNATSAWNAVLSGSKYWIMFPSATDVPPPPGVYVSDDQSEVTSPLSIAEWLLTYHEEARHTPDCKEGICHSGEVLHVPSGWWHLVVNLEASTAITQNFIPKAHLAAALDFLQNKREQVSGFKLSVKDPYTSFVKKIEDNAPHLLAALTDTRTGKRKWDEIACEDDKSQNGTREAFTFEFADGSDEDVP
ncbi:MAG: hypothetical protein Q9227_002518 [Pyrenula ochraceoflavens]